MTKRIVDVLIGDGEIGTDEIGFIKISDYPDIDDQDMIIRAKYSQIYGKFGDVQVRDGKVYFDDGK